MNASRERELFKARVFEWANKLDVRIHALAVRPMRKKWASCSTAGNLNFNDELLALDAEVADYVIVHELLHFFVPNHGRLWKSLMRAHLGNYERLQARLESTDLTT
jgi:predicted metal-dependent hydrolase